VNKKITVILIIITLIVSAVIIYTIKEDKGLDFFYVIDKSKDSEILNKTVDSLIFYSSDNPDIYIFLKFKNINKGEKLRLVILSDNLENENSKKEIFQTTDIITEKEGPQIIEISLAKSGNSYKLGKYLVELYSNEKLIDTKEFTIK